jgi:UDP-N-acetylglucosamine transferase subunit ALG13
MIFVTVGTQDKQFSRPLIALEKLKKEGKIKDEIIVQAGHTEFKSEYMKVLTYIPYAEFNDYNDKADIVITHGGVGSIISALRLDKKVIAIARLAKYSEHINDHQLQAIDELSKAGYIIECNDENMFEEKIKEARTFVPKKYISNTENFNKNILENINHLWDKNTKKEKN